MICAALRMAPNIDHFELEDQPDMMMPTTISAVTAMMKKMPTFMSAMISRWLNGSVTNTQANPTIMKRLGPTRDCMRAATRRSAQEKMPAVMAAKLMTMKANSPMNAR